MKLFVDDIRPNPSEDWTLARTVTEAIRAISHFDFEEISLDHDISHKVTMSAIDRPYPCGECFCSVAYYIAEKYWIDRPFEKEFRATAEKVTGKKLKDLHIARPLAGPKITIHTSNPGGAQEMLMILKDAGISATINLSEPSNGLEMKE